MQGAPVPRSKVQVGVVTSLRARGGLYFERFYRNSNGWHREFEDVRAYTFDEIHPDSPLGAAITSKARLRNVTGVTEEDGAKGKYGTFLMLPMWKYMYEANPDAEWYLGTDDDSVIFRDNLMHMLESQALPWVTPERLVMLGKCAGVMNQPDPDTAGEWPITAATQPRTTHYSFQIGGAGIVLSNALLKRLLPHVDECRIKYNFFGKTDTLLGACVTRDVVGCKREPDRATGLPNPTCELEPLCSGRRPYRFSSAALENELAEAAKFNYLGTMPISLQEKEPDRLTLLNDEIRRRQMAGERITLEGLQGFAEQSLACVGNASNPQCGAGNGMWRAAGGLRAGAGLRRGTRASGWRTTSAVVHMERVAGWPAGT